MQITKVCCQGCGANLEVDESIRFVTCNYCHARLEVVHDTSTTHTKLLEALDQRTESMAQDIKVLKLENELERLDREWESVRQSMMIRGKNGSVSEPSATSATFGGIIAIVGGLFWMIFTGSMGAPGPFPLFGLVFIGAGIFGMVSGNGKASEFEGLRSRYQMRRGQLISQIEQEKRRRA
ncbi:MAG: hypothetical protein CFE26_17565 [Verrucomicrobiales bacterium VVV1]|nr:MAG: hypothetical protein CFE26_17565 [Verrucomicrobiales bacterium VVV1]